METLEIQGIEINIERKRIKNIHLYVHPPYGNVTVSAPLKMSNETIVQFVLSKSEWIRKNQEKFQKQEIVINRYMSGEAVNVWGTRCNLTVLPSDSTNVIKNGNDVLLLIKKDSSFEERKKAMYEWYKSLMKNAINESSAKWEELMGVDPSGYTIRDMRSRWGTCNTSTKRICLNIQLAKKDPECFEYVLVHELCHLLEASHNHVFKAYMDIYLPNWKKIKEKLNAQAIGAF